MKTTFLSLALLGVASLGATSAYACEDWSYNDPQCPQYINYETMGKAAYGMPAGEERGMPMALSCEDWSYNDSRCGAYIREGSGSTDRNFVAPRTLMESSEF